MQQGSKPGKKSYEERVAEAVIIKRQSKFKNKENKRNLIIKGEKKHISNMRKKLEQNNVALDR